MNQVKFIDAFEVIVLIKKNYFPHIDGLRAIAVLSVIIFHFDGTYLSGGFVGVDIFFVISGFLITKIIYSQLMEERFSIKSFYLKRMKRILPVYFLVSSLTFLFAWLFFFPDDLENYSSSLLASNFFISNLYFWRTAGYFSQNSEYFPLLHTWSLSVEEQYYLFWPVLLFLSVKKLSKYYNLGILLSFSILASLLISIYFSINYPNFAYFSLFTRIFELMFGASAAVYSNKIQSFNRYHSLMNYTGFTLIAFSIFTINRDFFFPGWVALFPTIGTVLLLHATTSKDNLVIRLLSSSTFVGIGVISYSLYMWHWPILAFLRYYFIKPEAYQFAYAAVLIFGVSYISCHFFERKIIKSTLNFKKSLVILFIFPTIALSSIAIFSIINLGIPQRYDSQMISKFEEAKSVSSVCSYEHLNFKINRKCKLSSNSFKYKPIKKILLWGDSHANHFIPFFKELNNYINYELDVMSFPGCPPIPGVYRVNRSYSESCYKHNNKVLDHIINASKYDYVIFAANWVNYTKGTNLGDVSSKALTINNSERALFENLLSLFSTLSEKSINFIILGSVPNFENNPSECVMKYHLFVGVDEALCHTNKDFLLSRRSKFENFLKDQSAIYEFKHIDFVKYFCDEYLCKAQIDDVLMYSDKNHLSEIGAKKLFSLSINDFTFMGLQDK